MTDKKISQLTAVTTPLAGTEVLPIVQSSTTKKVTVAAGAATLNSYSGLLSTMGQYAVISLVSPVADEFIAAGNLGV